MLLVLTFGLLCFIDWLRGSNCDCPSYW